MPINTPYPMLFILWTLLTAAAAVTADAAVTVEFITKNKYPVEEHKVHTDDGYVLTVYRIPHSRSANGGRRRPAVLLQHGFALTSDAWVIPDVKVGLAYQLADVGFDVWLGNQRGNTYSREHATLTVAERAFWNFSFHEIGYYDIAAIVDYMRATTGQQSVHFVGYSQGTSTLFVLLTTRPEYAQRISTVHLLAPVVYMQRMKSLFATVGVALLELGMSVSRLFGYREVLQASSMPLHKYMCQWGCHNSSPLKFVCQKIFEMIGGFGTKNMDLSLLADICLTHPAGASSKQILHFLQVYNTGRFGQYDYGYANLNLEHYQQDQPPHYDIRNVTKCVNLYYGHNDYLSAAGDVLELGSVLQCAHMHELPYEDWNHYDFLWSTNLNEALNDDIISRMQEFEEYSRRAS